MKYFSESCAEIPKAKLLRYLNELLFEIVNTALKDTYLGGTTHTALKYEVSTSRKIYYDRETHIMVNQLVNDFYTRFLFKMDALPHNFAFPLDIDATLFNKSSTDVREFLISERVQVTQRPPTENNHQVNQSILFVINMAVESEKNIITVKAAAQPAIGSRHPKTFMGMLARNTSTQMAGLGNSF